MTDKKNAPTRSLLEEELLNSSPEYVYSWLKRRWQDNAKIPTQSGQSNIELAVLGRNNRLITLGVAQYGIDDDALAVVFKNAIESDDKTIKLACLSNTAAAKAQYALSGVPTILFSNPKTEMLVWFSSISEEEVTTLLRNEAIDDDFLTEFLEGKTTWNAVNDDIRCSALNALAQNPRLKQQYKGPMDGWAEYKHRLPADAICKLAGKLPVTQQYANVLGALLESVGGGGSGNDSKKQEYLDAAARWAVPEDKEEGEVKKWLSGFETVRHGVFKNVVRPSKSNEKNEYLTHDDIAVRTAAYETIKVGTEQIKGAYEKDGLIAIEYLQRNLWVWKYPEARKALHDICWDADSRYNRNYLDCANAFNYHKEELEKEHADWFKEDEPLDQVEPQDPNEQPVTLGQFNDLSQQHGVELMREILKIRKDLSVTRTLIIVLIALVVALAVFHGR